MNPDQEKLLKQQLEQHGLSADAKFLFLSIMENSDESGDCRKRLDQVFFEANFDPGRMHAALAELRSKELVDLVDPDGGVI